MYIPTWHISFLLQLDEDEQEQIRYLEPQAFQVQVLSGIKRLLLAIAARQPVVLVLEDLHWADPSSVDFLVQLLPLASTERIIVLPGDAP